MNTENLRNSAPLIVVAVLMGAVIALAGSFVFDRADRDVAELEETADVAQLDPVATDSDDWAAPRAAITIPAGTRLAVRLGETLSTKTTSTGEQFNAQLVAPVVVDGRTVIPAGATVHGRVTQAARSARIGGRAKMTLALTSVDVNGESHPLSASYTVLGKKQTAKDAATIGGATAGGALLGRIIGHNNGDEAKGTLVGAVVGGAAGTGVAMSNRAPHVVLPAGTTIRVTLGSSVTV